MNKTINIPIGSTIRVTRDDGSHDIYVFRGSDAIGVFYEGSDGVRHNDIGVYVEIAIKSINGWNTL